ncbi:MAG: hypothetical protein ACPL1F_04435 [bacterium]
MYLGISDDGSLIGLKNVEELLEIGIFIKEGFTGKGTCYELSSQWY